MIRILKLGVPFAVILANVACVEFNSTVKVTADGGAQVVVSTLVQEHFLSIMRKMADGDEDVTKKMKKDFPSALTKEDEAALTALGGKVNKISATTDEAGIHWDTDVSYQSLTALSQPQTGALQRAVPALQVVDLGGGTYQMTMLPPKGGGMGPDALTGGDDEPKKKKKSKKKSKKDMAKAMESLGELMGTMMEMKVSFALEVPGEILSVTPPEGVIAGHVATWSIDGATIQAKMAEQSAGLLSAMPTEPGAEAPPPPENKPDVYSVTFKMPEGTSLPASLLTPAG